MNRLPAEDLATAKSVRSTMSYVPGQTTTVLPWEFRRDIGGMAVVSQVDPSSYFGLTARSFESFLNFAVAEALALAQRAELGEIERDAPFFIKPNATFELMAKPHFAHKSTPLWQMNEYFESDLEA